MLTAENVLLALKVAVGGVTILLLFSLIALARGNYKLHGRFNLAFFILVLTALLGFELMAHVVKPGMLQEFLKSHDALDALYIHLGFSVPSALVLPVMLYTGVKRQRWVHISLGVVFLVLWSGTVITGIFYLPHTPAVR